MWEHLWDDFEARALRLAGDPVALDAVDATVLWQITGHQPWVDAPIPVPALHLPELCSGAPWALCDVPELSGWVAWVTVNPSIRSDEIYPSRADRAQIGHEELIDYFNQRFEPGPLNVHGIRRGCDDDERIRVWLNPRANPLSAGQQTWSRIDNRLSACLQHRGLTSRAPLGRVGAIVDVVPWKFAKWSAATELQEALLGLGAPYLQWTLNERKSSPRPVLRCMRTAMPQELVYGAARSS
jgi:hypothetical protein